MWYRGAEAITNGATPLKPKYKVVGGTKLTITAAAESDEGAYFCTILPYDNISLKFNLAAGNVNEVVYDGKSGASIVSIAGALLMAAYFSTVFVTI